MDYFFVAAGLIGLFFGGEALVRGSVSVARRLAISPFLIGLTIVGFGTSTPELLVSIDAAWHGSPDIALGNIVGSNIANMLLIVGISAVVWPIMVVGSTLRRDTTFMLGAGFVLIPIFWLGIISRPAGIILVMGLVWYLFLSFRQPHNTDNESKDSSLQTSLGVSLAWIIGGLIALMFGARFLVDGAGSIAREYGISEAFIGLTIVAVGTSLPELATSLIAAARQQSEIAIGNIVGSNIFNIFGILGVTAIISPVPVGNRFLVFDLPVMIIATIALTALLLTRPVIGRVVGLFMLSGYGVYVWFAQGY